MSMDNFEKYTDPKYDPKVGDQGWAAVGRENMFTRMVLEMRFNRIKFKEAKQQATFDKTRKVLTEDKIEEYQRITLIDPVTNLINSRAFKKRLRYEIKRAKRYKRPLSLLVMSIDGLSDLSRQFGTLVVDDCLQTAAKIIHSAIRDVDIAARCNKDQLAIIFPETYSSRAVVVGERIRERFRVEPINEDLRNLRVTTSIGVVSFPTHARDEIDLLNKAYEFLKISQDEGGDKVHNG